MARINKLLKAAGREEVLVRGNGYYYLTEGAAHTWYSSSIPTYSLKQVTFAQAISMVEMVYQQNNITIKL